MYKPRTRFRDFAKFTLVTLNSVMTDPEVSPCERSFGKARRYELCVLCMLTPDQGAFCENLLRVLLKKYSDIHSDKQYPIAARGIGRQQILVVHMHSMQLSEQKCVV